MKAIHKITSFIALAVLVLCSTSCLKDDPFIDWSKLGVVIEMPYNTHILTKQNVEPGDDVSYDLKVYYTIDYASKVTSDIPVTIAVDENMVETYNATLPSNAQKYELLPNGTYTLPGQIVIKKGTQLAEANMAVSTASLTPGTYYILPVKIVGVPDGYTISGNFGHVYLRLQMR